MKELRCESCCVLLAELSNGTRLRIGAKVYCQKCYDVNDVTYRPIKKDSDKSVEQLRELFGMVK